MTNTTKNTIDKIPMPEEILNAVKKYFETPVQKLFVGDNAVKPSLYAKYGIDPDKPTPLYVLMDELIKDNEQTEQAISAEDPSMLPSRNVMYMLMYISRSLPEAAPEFFSLKVMDFFAYMCSRADRMKYEDIYSAVLMVAHYNYSQFLDSQEKPPEITPDMDFKTLFSIAFSSYELGCLLRNSSKKNSTIILDSANSIMVTLTLNIYSALFNRTDSGISVKPEFLVNTSY